MQTTNDNTAAPKPVLDKQTKLPRWRITLSRIKRRVFKHVWLLRGLIVLGVFTLLLVILSLLFPLFSDTKAGFYASLAKDFITTPAGKIDTTDGRVNILILGKGGADHEAPDLTDTIIYASLTPANERVDLVSIPRDIWIPSIRAKVNSSYYWGNQKQPPSENDLGGGLILAKSSVEEVVGQNVHYGVVVNFDGFSKLIDVMGGIEVDVESSFTDEKYPIAGREDDNCLPAQAGDGDPEFSCRYETLEFTKGSQQMDGDTALKFVRSRNAEGDEGTDFARAKRQQLVIDALRKKAVSRGILFSPRKILEIRDAVLDAVETDITTTEAAILARWFYDAKDSLQSHVLPEEFLFNPPISPRYDNLYVFIPEGDDPDTPEHDWGRAHAWVESVFNK